MDPTHVNRAFRFVIGPDEYATWAREYWIRSRDANRRTALSVVALLGIVVSVAALTALFGDRMGGALFGGAGLLSLAFHYRLCPKERIAKGVAERARRDWNQDGQLRRVMGGETKLTADEVGLRRENDEHTHSAKWSAVQKAAAVRGCCLIWCGAGMMLMVPASAFAPDPDMEEFVESVNARSGQETRSSNNTSRN